MSCYSRKNIKERDKKQLKTEKMKYSTVEKITLILLIIGSTTTIIYLIKLVVWLISLLFDGLNSLANTI